MVALNVAVTLWLVVVRDTEGRFVDRLLMDGP
jgi:hypothetical protein